MLNRLIPLLLVAVAVGCGEPTFISVLYEDHWGMVRDFECREVQGGWITEVRGSHGDSRIVSFAHPSHYPKPWIVLSTLASQTEDSCAVDVEVWPNRYSVDQQFSPDCTFGEVIVHEETE